jgi:3-oxoacyl-[acyl-carrier-protein] synthase-3
LSRETADPPEVHPEGQELMRELMLVWLEFERRLGKVPILQRLEESRFTTADYLVLLRNLRAQVVDGARWITRAASSFTSAHLELRSATIAHAHDEHRDYEMLEADFVAAGGRLEEIRTAPQNIGTEALTSYMMHRASLPDPVDLLGAMFIIEGLGERMASRWARKIQEALGIPAGGTRFLGYHAANDDRHLDTLRRIVGSPAVTAETAPRIVKTAKVVARLYALQLEELDHV